MRHLLTATLAALTLTGAAAAEPLPGFDRLVVEAPHRPAPLAASVWYPAGGETYRMPVGDNALFVGETVQMGAPVAEGVFPLVLLSHGSGGRADAFAWLAASLARKGVMVLAVDHPGSMTGDSSPRRSLRLHERTADVSRALDQLLADPAFAGHVDPGRISVLGFSLGGGTALQLGGLRVDRDLYQAYCERVGDDAQDCLFWSKGGVDLAALPAEIEGDLGDPRFGAVIAVDPGFTYGLDPASVAAADRRFLLVNLGDDALWPAVDVGPEGSDLEGRLGDATRVVVAPANHFTFLPVCKEGGAELLAAHDDDPICDDPEGADRAAVHATIERHVLAFLGL